jgi:hypothetical protein
MTTSFYDHWRKASEGAWRWPNFSTGRLLRREHCANGWASR